MRILLADDHQLFLDGLRGILLGMDAGADIVCARDGNAALEFLETGTFDIALVDLRLPARNGFALLEELEGMNCLTPVIIVTASDNPEDRRRALDAGAAGFVTKSASAGQITEAIRAVLRGEPADSIGMTENMARNQQEWARIHGLSRKRMEVLRLMSRGLSNQEIAERMSISLATVKSHVAALFKRFDASNRTETIEKARRHGLE